MTISCLPSSWRLYWRRRRPVIFMYGKEKSTFSCRSSVRKVYQHDICLIGLQDLHARFCPSVAIIVDLNTISLCKALSGNGTVCINITKGALSLKTPIFTVLTFLMATKSSELSLYQEDPTRLHRNLCQTKSDAQKREKTLKSFKS